jgi:hypothetical protein
MGTISEFAASLRYLGQLGPKFDMISLLFSTNVLDFSGPRWPKCPVRIGKLRGGCQSIVNRRRQGCERRLLAAASRRRINNPPPVGNRPHTIAAEA